MHPQAIASNNVTVSLAAAPDKKPCGRARDACGGDRRVQLPATLNEPWLIGLQFFFCARRTAVVCFSDSRRDSPRSSVHQVQGVTVARRAQASGTAVRHADPQLPNPTFPYSRSTEQARRQFRASRQGKLHGTVRRDCLDHMPVGGARHSHRVQKECVERLNRAWPHLGIAKGSPDGSCPRKPGGDEESPSPSPCLTDCTPTAGALRKAKNPSKNAGI